MNILFTYKKQLSTFSESDVRLLKTMGQVTEYRFKEIKKPAQLLEFIRQLIHILVNRYDVYYCYFCDYHSLIPVLYAKLTRRKSIVIVAGFDAMGNRDLNYGIFLSRWRGWIARRIYKYASHILTNTDALQAELKNNGIRLDERFKTVYFGFDPDDFQVAEKLDICLLVGVANDHANFMRKGYDGFFKLAAMMPECQFISVGLSSEDIPDKVVNYSYMNHRDVLRLMSKTKVYMQPSRSEGFSAAITEAMLLGCKIIVSDANGIPENYPGYCFTQKEWDDDLSLIAGKVFMVMHEPVDDNLVKYAASKFNLKIRKERLSEIINSKT